MKNNKLIVTLIIMTTICTIALLVVTRGSGGNNLVSPWVDPFRKSNIEPQTPTPTPTVKQFKFENSTDLKKELDSINPQILDSDFE